MTDVMICVDPHKGSLTAVAVDAAETTLGQIRVIARGASQAKKRRAPLRSPRASNGRGDVVDVRRAIMHELRGLNTNRADKPPYRSS